MSSMECCVSVSTETVLQLIDKFYSAVRRILELTFWTVFLCHSECIQTLWWLLVCHPENSELLNHNKHRFNLWIIWKVKFLLSISIVIMKTSFHFEVFACCCCFVCIWLLPQCRIISTALTTPGIPWKFNMEFWNFLPGPWKTTGKTDNFPVHLENSWNFVEKQPN